MTKINRLETIARERLSNVLFLIRERENRDGKSLRENFSRASPWDAKLYSLKEDTIRCTFTEAYGSTSDYYVKIASSCRDICAFVANLQRARAYSILAYFSAAALCYILLPYCARYKFYFYLGNYLSFSRCRDRYARWEKI